jgi:TP901 family phage tail tape measure protein
VAVLVNIITSYSGAGAKKAMRDMTLMQKQAKLAGAGVTAGMLGASRSLRGAGAQMSATGTLLSKKITVPTLAMAGASVYAFAKFEDAMTKSTAIMGEQGERFGKRMADTAREIARHTTISHEEAANSFYYLASAGLKAKQAIAALPAVARFAEAGAFDMARATELAMDTQSALGMRAKNAGENLSQLTRVTDVLVKANVLANASVEQFSESLTNKAGAALKTVGKDIEEGTAVLAAFADQGVKGRLAGNQLAIVTRDLQKATLDNAGAFKKNGVAVYDSRGEMRNYADIIGDMEGALDGMSDKQKKATLAAMGFTDKSGASLLALIGTSDKIREYEKELRSAGGYTKDVAEKQLQSFAAQMKILRNNVVDVGITIGGALAPHLIALGKRVKSVVDWFAGLDKKTQGTILKVVGFAAALGPALKIIGMLTGGAGRLVGTVGKLSLAFGKGGKDAPKWARGIAAVTKGLASFIKQAALAIASIVRQTAVWVAHTAATVAHRAASIAVAAAQKAQAAGQWLLNAAMTANPIGLVIAAIAAMVAIFVIAYKKSETFRKVVTKAWEAIKRATRAVFDWIVGFLKKWGPRILIALTGPLGIVVALVIKNWQKIKDGAVSAFNAVVEYVRGIPGRIASAVGGGAKVLYSFGADMLRGVWKGMSSIAGWLKDKVLRFFKDLLPGWAKKALGIHSRSKVFAEIGRYAGLGLALGMDGTQPMVRRAALALAGASLPPFGGPGGFRGAGGGYGRSGGVVVARGAVQVEITVGAGVRPGEIKTAARSGLEKALVKLAREINAT